MNEVFISYKSNEFDEAVRIKRELEKNSISCWMAPMSISGGASYASEIPKAIRDCKVFLLMLSNGAQLSKWVPKELDQAINQNKLVMPFMFEKCKLCDEFSFYLNNVQIYFAYEAPQETLDRLINDIKNALGIKDESVEPNEPDLTATEPSKEKVVKIESKPKSKQKKKTEVKHKKVNFKALLTGVLSVIIAVVLLFVGINVASNTKIAGEKVKKSAYSITLEDKLLTLDDVRKILLMKNLTDVHLTNCVIDVKCFNALMTKSNLHSADFDGCKIDDSFTQSLDLTGSQLFNIAFDNNEISDLSFIAPLSETLENLSVNNTNVSDISVLQGFNLKKFSAENCNINDISSLSSSKEITEININSNNIYDISALSEALDLQVIKAADNNISDISGLANSTVLVTVDLSGNGIEDASVLSKSSASINKVYLNSNKISDISFLSEAVNLSVFSADSNNITSLDALENCSQLNILSISDNKLSSLSGLQNCNNLTYINASGNEISDVSAISSLELPDGSLSLNLINNTYVDFAQLPDVKYDRLLLCNTEPDWSAYKLHNVRVLSVDYSEALPTQAIIDSQIYRVYIIGCPLDQQKRISNEIGQYYVSFVSYDEFESILAEDNL